MAAKKLHRTQPAVSQAIRRLEEELGDRLFDRSVRNGALTEAGRLLQEYAGRLLSLAADAEVAVRELQQVRRGRVIIGANEAAVHTLLPFLDRFAKAHPQALVEVRRVRSRAIAAELLNRSLDFGVLTFQPADRGLQSLSLGGDELVMLAHPKHPLASAAPGDDRRGRPADGDRAQRSVAGARARAPRLRAPAHADQHPGRAAEPRRHQARGRDGGGRRRAAAAVRARREIARGQLVAIKVPGLSARRQVRLVFRRGEQSHAAEAFLDIVKTTAAFGEVS